MDGTVPFGGCKGYRYSLSFRSGFEMSRGLGPQWPRGISSHTQAYCHLRISPPNPTSNFRGSSQSSMNSCSHPCPLSIAAIWYRRKVLDAGCASLLVASPSGCFSIIIFMSITVSMAPRPLRPANALSCHSSSLACDSCALSISANFPIVFASTIGCHPFTHVWSFPGLRSITIFMWWMGGAPGERVV